ncbi:MAG: serine/threonine protein kinase [Deltaproteobacteria bacterium]|nr:serine/threonine protein kinase [Deltaproteobacteria bacterium]
MPARTIRRTLLPVGGTATPILGRYQVLRRLAAGGMGEVHLARDLRATGTHRLVILKSLLPSLIDDPALVDGFLDEARVASSVRHPNIVLVHETGSWEGAWYIVMEHIHGADLVQLIKAMVTRRALVPWPIAATIMADAALGLDHAHRARDPQGRPLNIVHRDISPGNIMVRVDGVTKVVDFGIASAANRVTHTMTGQIKGKLAYMAPEQLFIQPLDGRCDQFSLGIVFWELCAGRRLFRARTDSQMANNVLAMPIPPLSSVQRGVPPEVDAVVARMLQRDRALRFPSCHEVAVALDNCLGAYAMRPPVDRWVRALVGPMIEAEPLPAPAAGTPFADVATLVLPRQGFEEIAATQPAALLEGEDVDLSDLEDSGMGGVAAQPETGGDDDDPWQIPTQPPEGTPLPAPPPMPREEDPWTIHHAPPEGVHLPPVGAPPPRRR